MSALRRRRVAVAGLLLGVGLGGLFDGIVLHQVLQWHHMVSVPAPPNTLANLEANTLADGLFHALAWLITIAGVWLLLMSRQDGRSVGAGTKLQGGFLVGWGTFNLVEGLIDHHILNLHHVRSGSDSDLYDLAFLGWGAVMLLAGLWLIRRAPPERSEPR